MYLLMIFCGALRGLEEQRR